MTEDTVPDIEMLEPSIEETDTESSIPVAPKKRERSEKQLAALKVAQEKAAAKRAAKAQEKREQSERDKALLEELKSEKLVAQETRIMEEDGDSQGSEVPTGSRSNPRKPPKRVIHVTEVSSGEEEEEIEVRIPKKRVTAEEALFHRSMQKMFTIG